MITGGRVSFTRTVQPAPYESKSATVELSFDTAETLDQASTLAVAKALAMVGLRPAWIDAGAATNIILDADTISDADRAKAAFAASNAAPGAGSEDKKPPGPVGDKGKSTGKAARPPKASVPEVNGAKVTPANPAAIEEEEVVTMDAAVATAKDPAAIDDDELFSSAVAEITDADLIKEITEHNGKVKNPLKIRELVGRYLDKPGKATDIAQRKRAAFVIELKTIKPLV